MPQNPLDFFNRLLPAPLPTRKPTLQEEENRDFQAQAIQDQETGARKGFRNLIDLTTDFFTGDPFTSPESERKGITKMSPGSGLGMMAAAAPLGIPKRLPVIAPEAYQDVKAGGLRLYSRLTDAFAKAPKMMTPDKIRSVAKSGAAAEEIQLRKLEDFLSGRQPMEKVEREAVMQHLREHPLELDVVRKGEGMVDPEAKKAMDDFTRFQHELDTKYGGNWDTPAGHIGRNGPRISEEEWQQFKDLQQLADDLAEATKGAGHVQYDGLQTPGPKENYGETLINLPLKTPEEKIGAAFAGTKHDPGVTFTSTHWDEPNNLVWSRYNDRYVGGNPEPLKELGLQPTYDETGALKGAHNQQGGVIPRAETYSNWKGRYVEDDPNVAAAYEQARPFKGRFIEEIQSDAHQQAREIGYRGRPETYFTNVDSPKLSGQTREVGPNQPFPPYTEESEYIFNLPDGTGYSGWGTNPQEALQDASQYYEGHNNIVPDMPFKDTYHELALKEQLLDAANQPDLEWLGVADAVTASQVEGHTAVPGGKGIKPGMELFYDKRHPTALEKLLKPLGGEVTYDHLPFAGQASTPLTLTNADALPRNHGDWPSSTFGRQNAAATNYPEVTVLEANNWRMPPGPRSKEVIAEVQKREPAGPGFWKAPLPPELKQLIKERGFPAMAAFLALFNSLQPQEEY